MEPEDLRLQVGWVYVGAWWGQKAEMLKKCWFLKLFLRGQEGHGYARETNSRVGRTVREGEKVILLIKNGLWLYSELCFLCWRGAHFQKNHEKSSQMIKNGAGRH